MYVFIVFSIHFQVLIVFPGSLETAVTEGGGTRQDMIMNFFMKRRVRLKDGSEVWVKRRAEIVQIYVRSWFLIDLLSILPFDTVGVACNPP